MIETARLELHHWHDRHREAFARMHADPEVMADLGGPIGPSESSKKFARYLRAQDELGVSRWAVEDGVGAFLGYAGGVPRPDENHPLGSHHEVGWRLTRASWGRGFATEAARPALRHASEDLGLRRIVSYTGVDNHRSQSVMGKLNLVRDAASDFVLVTPGGLLWNGLVWRVPVQI